MWGLMVLTIGLAHAQSVQDGNGLATWADRLTKFGEMIPQEKVYVHMDNTSYFLGDTIWFAAYTRRTDKAVPSNISRVLYVELLNHDGFLVERQLIEMKGGHGHGNFALTDSMLYAGYYELRAYTRWQLNWGMFEHPHTNNAEQWFFSRGLAKEYYRDYDKLYSRVFPVYDRPKKDGEFFHDMSLRPLRREPKQDKNANTPMLTCYPEGGRMVVGAKCLLAFEAATRAGEWLEGDLTVYDDKHKPVATAKAEHRGRGTVAFTPKAGTSYSVEFVSSDTLNAGTATVSLKDIPTNGVALHVSQNGDKWNISIQPRGLAAERSLGMTIMHEGVVEKYQAASTCTVASSELKAGVNQVTVFDSTGCVWADRLFFVNTPQTTANITIEGLKDNYEPYEAARLKLSLNGSLPIGRAGEGSEAIISVAVRNGGLHDYTYDSGTIMTEMLLASEIRGFVPQPEWYFESNDDEHRRGLDLLMMTQGWRRFNWLTMATPKAFTLHHPAEYTQVLTGTVYRYEAQKKEDKLREQVEKEHEQFMTEEVGDNGLHVTESDTEDENANNEGAFSNDDVFADMVAASKRDIIRQGSQYLTGNMARNRYYENMGNLKREVRVHAEFTQEGSQSIEGDVETRNGNFRINTPNIGGYCVFFLAASDTTQWKAGHQHLWVDTDEENYPEFYVRLNFPYPRFVNPYTYYQTLVRNAPDGVSLEEDFAWAAAEAAHTLQTVHVSGRRRGLRKFDITKPAFIRDAYEAYNDAVDAGLMVAWYSGHSDYVTSVARNYIGDMNMERNYAIENRYEGHNSTYNHGYKALDDYNYLYNLDKVVIYTDYSPRREGDRSFSQDNQPTVTVNLQRNPDQGQRVTYRDRRYILMGFAQPDEFYNPDYSRNTPTAPADYRRTLYWNPALRLTPDTPAQIEFFNGSRPATLSVSAEGQSTNGILLTQ